MRLWAALLLGVLTALSAGCAAGATRSAWLPRRPLLQVPEGPDVVVLSVALLERPVGDRYFNGELWDSADEQAAALDRRQALEDNGFRVAQVGGIIPPRLQRLLTSPRSCANPRRLYLHAGHPTTVTLGPAQADCRYVISTDGQQTPVALERAACTLLITPTLLRDGRTRLRFVPQVQHGETILVPEPTSDPAGIYKWELHEHRPAERYDALSWDVELAPNEWVLVGGRYDRPDSLGHRCFISKDPAAPGQRLLVIRAGRPAAVIDTASTASEPGEQAAEEQVPPVALQAACTPVGGE
jgi:hypothetical protein